MGGEDETQHQYSLFVIRYSLFVICSLLTGHWETFHTSTSSVTGTSLHWSLITDYCLLITDHWSLVTAMGGGNETQHSLPIICNSVKSY
ncbi:hypothetical protein [Dactylococcopsis salina]|uniref:hypothetical protein n=1 Tax=Dactylococcopsis salina TaxID=292566 RepID=UPI0002F6E1A2|nr:hypothetical protein [Dactylococcopsis salina]